MAATVRDNPVLSRFEVYEGGQLAGYSAYRLHESFITFTHTEMEPRFEGKGLGSTLVRHALDEAQDRGLSVLSTCPFVRRFVARHDGYVDLVPTEHRERFGLSPSRS